MSEQLPITEGLFVWPAEKPQLIGGHCKSCGSVFFPKQDVVHKPGCPNEDVAEMLLSIEGRLISYTWQYYSPPPPFKVDTFVPFGIGLVELKEGIRVTGILTDCKLEDLSLGMPMHLVTGKLFTDEAGNERLTWKFRPVGAKG